LLSTTNIETSIVAVHGLNPLNSADHHINTWQKTDKDGNERLWLRDRLPTVQPGARVFIYSYDSKPTFGENKGRFLWQADALLADIESYRDEVGAELAILTVAALTSEVSNSTSHSPRA
jgi:hypothetical protein